MIHVAIDITAYARNRFGGVARVCAATAAELARYDDLSVTAYWQKGEKPSLQSSVTFKRFGILDHIIKPTADITHSLCHRMLPVKSHFHVYSVHDAWSLHPNRYQSPAFQQKLGARLRRDMERADLIVTGSQWTRSELLRLGAVDNDKCVVVPDGVTIPSAVSNSTEILVKHGLAPQKYALFVGRLEYRKNLSHIVAAMRDLNDLRLVCVGEPGFGYEDSVILELAKLNSDRLIVISRINDSDLSTLYANALAAIQPSWDEGFGLPVLEAMAHGCPVITSNCGATREVGEGAAVLVDPAVPEESRQALQRIRDDESFRTKLIKAGDARAREFTWQNYGERLAGIYRGLKAGRSKAE